jgi:hypothetical protein
MKEDTWEKESQEWQQASADDIIKNMDDTKNIAEKLLNSFNLDGKITELHAEEIKSLILTELQALKEEVLKKILEDIRKYQTIVEKCDTTIMKEDYSEEFGKKDAYEMLKRNISKVDAVQEVDNYVIEAFEKRGVK